MKRKEEEKKERKSKTKNQQKMKVCFLRCLGIAFTLTRANAHEPDYIVIALRRYCSHGSWSIWCRPSQPACPSTTIFFRFTLHIWKGACCHQRDLRLCTQYTTVCVHGRGCVSVNMCACVYFGVRVLKRQHFIFQWAAISNNKRMLEMWLYSTPVGPKLLTRFINTFVY